MKRIILAFTAAVALLASCKPAAVEVPGGVPEGYGILTIDVAKTGAAPTRTVAAYTGSKSYETQVNKVQIFVFYRGGNQNGVLAARLTGTTETSGYSVELPVGDYTVYVQINGQDKSPASATEFNNYTAPLDVNSITASTGFLMIGSADASVTSSGGSCTVNVARLLNRISVSRITNGMPSTNITINRMWLANVVTPQRYDNSISGDNRTWVHKFSRSEDFTTPIPSLPAKLISTFTAPSLTSRNFNETLSPSGRIGYEGAFCLYAYANLHDSSITPAESNVACTTGSSAVTEWEPTQTRLVFEATIGTTKYYYPCDIVLGTNNQAHTVEITISGPGLTDPQGNPHDLDKKALSVSIVVSGWNDGTEYELNY